MRELLRLWRLPINAINFSVSKSNKALNKHLPNSDQIRFGGREMEKKVAIVLSLILLIISANMEAVNSDASDCNDACSTGCVNRDPRLEARCNAKCGIRCSPGVEVEVNEHLK